MKKIQNIIFYYVSKSSPWKKVVTGLTNMFIADVPTPIGLPFAFSTEQKKNLGFFHHLVSKTIEGIFCKMAAIILP